MNSKTSKYQVIGSVAHFAATDFSLSVTAAKRCLRAVKFSNGVPALAWMFGFRTRDDAEQFVARCNAQLAFKAGRIGRWITPSFVVVESAMMAK